MKYIDLSSDNSIFESIQFFHLTYFYSFSTFFLFSLSNLLHSNIDNVTHLLTTFFNITLDSRKITLKLIYYSKFNFKILISLQRIPLIFRSKNSAKPNIHSLKYHSFTSSGCKEN